jgi:hypothetical protein
MSCEHRRYSSISEASLVVELARLRLALQLIELLFELLSWLAP